MIDFRSPLHTNTRLINFPSVTKMFQFTELKILFQFPEGIDK